MELYQEIPSELTAPYVHAEPRIDPTDPYGHERF